MDIQKQNKVGNKLFVGVPLTKGLKIHLSESTDWNKEALSPSPSLQATTFQGKEYLGRYLFQAEAPLFQVKKDGKEVVSLIEQFCPRFSTTTLKPLVFSQVFVG